MNANKETLIQILPIGEAKHIATSEYSIDPIPSTGWNPIVKTHTSTLKSMEKAGILVCTYYWRGATVTRVK